MTRLLQILFWSVIAAAFIGPGTVTTAASSGTRFGLSLLWALLFSTIACLVLQEASARVAIVSNRTLAQAIRQRFSGGAVGWLVMVVVLGAIVLGCAAYQAGNILGSVAGARLQIGLPAAFLTLIIGGAAGVLLFFGSTQFVARTLGIIVALMGIMFLATAIMIKPSIAGLIKGTFVPALPPGSSLLVLGLIGTTVVPYNLFLGSGIAAGQSLGELRFGLSVAIVVGGIISMAILVVGTAIALPFGFEALSGELSNRLGGWAGTFFAIGLFAAGFSSAVTAPLAAAVTARGLFETSGNGKWHEHSWRYRCVWLGVLLTGIVFGALNVKPIPAIILAQALNGILLPFVAVFLWLIVNDRELMGGRGLNKPIPNLLMIAVVAVTITLGVAKTTQAFTSAFGLPAMSESTLVLASAAVTAALAIPIIRLTIRLRR
ncbi:MAG: Nramp family divalent metal transporter [Candidatus Latescibacterota bacterium]|nr:MAG: Nramp family divalent metal transporter [Candidatus Latescibacterota bacterium]